MSTPSRHRHFTPLLDTLPGGGAGLHIMETIIYLLDIHSICSFMNTSFIHQFDKNNRNKFMLLKIIEKIQYKYKKACKENLIRRYEFFHPLSTPFVLICQMGRLSDVKLFLRLHTFSTEIQTLKDIVNKDGKRSDCIERTPLGVAAENEHTDVVRYLLEYGKADPTIPDRYGQLPLHRAVWSNKKNTDCIQLLLNHMSTTSINQKTGYGKFTPLTLATRNESPIKQDIIDILRLHGGNLSGNSSGGCCVIS